MSSLPLTVAFTNYDRTQALYDGRVSIEGCEVNFFNIEPEEMFHRALHHEEFDVAELAIATFLQAKAYDKPLVLVPAVIVGGKAQHATLVYNAERNDFEPCDIEGRRGAAVGADAAESRGAAADLVRVSAGERAADRR